MPRLRDHRGADCAGSSASNAYTVFPIEATNMTLWRWPEISRSGSNQGKSVDAVVHCPRKELAEVSDVHVGRCENRLLKVCPGTPVVGTCDIGTVTVPPTEAATVLMTPSQVARVRMHTPRRPIEVYR